MMGYVHVYTGNGKGKTTAAVGLAVRAIGQGMRVYLGQFMKGVPYGELPLLSRLSDRIMIEQFGRPEFVHPEKPEPIDIQLAEKGLQRVREITQEHQFDVVILDEILVAIAYKLLRLSPVLELIEALKIRAEVVCTGRYAPEEIIQAADLVTEMIEIKHYFQKGIQARKGIEF